MQVFIQDILVSSGPVKRPGLQWEVFLSHFRMRIQMETFTTNRAGHLDLSRCLGLSPCQGREALHAQYTAPLLPHLVSRAVTVVWWIPFPLLQDRAFHTTTPFSYVPFSLSRGGKCGTLTCKAAVCHQIVVFFLAQASAPAASERSQPSCLLSSEKVDCWTGSWFHSPAGCFPHYNSSILAFPRNYQHVLTSRISTLSKARRAPALSTQPSLVPGGTYRQGLWEAAASRK